MSSARTAAGPHGRRVSHPPREHTDEGGGHVPPFWHDGTERPIHRPRDREEQQEYDSGTRKGHTIKNLLVIDETCRIGFLSATYEGKAHEKSLAELAGYPWPFGSYLYQEMGFQGLVLAGVTMVQPKKNPVGVNSRRLRKPPIDEAHRSASGLNRPLVG
jgi:DDE superfamily endonuclease